MSSELPVFSEFPAGGLGKTGLGGRGGSSASSVSPGRVRVSGVVAFQGIELGVAKGFIGSLSLDFVSCPCPCLVFLLLDKDGFLRDATL